VVSRSTVSKSFCWWVEAIGKSLSIGLRHRPWLPIASVMRRTPAANYSAEAPSNVNDFTLNLLFGRYFAGMTALPTQKMLFSVNRLLTAWVQNQFKCGAGRMYARLPQMARSENHFGPLLFSGHARSVARLRAGPPAGATDDPSPGNYAHQRSSETGCRISVALN
jgi:hypothetical protein